FQAAFLVFVRKAASIASKELLANWLYGVALQTARKARQTAAKRRARERQGTDMPRPGTGGPGPPRRAAPAPPAGAGGGPPGRLPDKYRIVVVLCDLEGKGRPEAARQLGLPEGTVASRLARARALWRSGWPGAAWP